MLTQGEMDARLARYNVTADARDLWPDVPPGALLAAQEEVARVASAVLAAAPGAVALGCPPGVDAHALGIAAFTGGMGPLLGFWIETGRLTARPDVVELFGEHLEQGRRRAARLGAECERILGALAARGIEPLLLKGTHTARVYFPEPGTRPTADIDLLVAPEQRASAADALSQLGFVEDPSTTLPQRVHWNPPGARRIRSLDLSHADDPWSVDLHVSLGRELLPGLTASFGALAPSDGEEWRAFSRPVRILPHPRLLAFLAAHLANHFSAMPLVRLVELVFVARRDFRGQVDQWRRFDDLVEHAGLGRFVYPALTLAEQVVPGTMDARSLARVEAAAPRRLRRHVQGLTPGSAQRLRTRPIRDRLLWAASFREVAILALDVVWPHGDRSIRHALTRQWGRVRRLVARLAARRPA